MTMMAFDLVKDQRNIVADKVMELSNLTVIALVIAQILGQKFDLQA